MLYRDIPRGGIFVHRENQMEEKTMEACCCRAGRKKERGGKEYRDLDWTKELEASKQNITDPSQTML